MNSLFALTIIFVIYAIGDIVSTKTHAIVSILVGKIFHESWYLCCAMSITALFGFPGTVIVPTGVTKAVAETEDEKKLIQGSIMPKMISPAWFPCPLFPLLSRASCPRGHNLFFADFVSFQFFYIPTRRKAASIPEAAFCIMT